MKRFRKFEKPCTKHSNHSKWFVYLSSYTLQLMAFFITLFTKKHIDYAFYYSKKQDDISFDYMLNYNKITYPVFKGKKYSECSYLTNGWNNWDDSKLVGIGNISDIQIIHN